MNQFMQHHFTAFGHAAIECDNAFLGQQRQPDKLIHVSCQKSKRYKCGSKSSLEWLKMRGLTSAIFYSIEAKQKNSSF